MLSDSLLQFLHLTLKHANLLNLRKVFLLRGLFLELCGFLKRKNVLDTIFDQLSLALKQFDFLNRLFLLCCTLFEKLLDK